MSLTQIKPSLFKLRHYLCNQKSHFA